MVLAAGLGVRMRPLTDHRPKPLVELAGKPLIDHVLDRLAQAGVDRVVVNVHYLPELIENHLKSRRRPAIAISDERGRLLDTGGGVRHALPLLGADCFFVHNADSVWIEGVQPILERMAAHWEPERMDSLLLLAAAQDAIGYGGRGDFVMDAQGLLARRGEGAISPFVFTGVSLAHRRLFDGAPDGAFSLNMLWDRAIASGRLYGVRHDGIWMHVGTGAALKEAERVMTRGRR